MSFLQKLFEHCVWDNFQMTFGIFAIFVFLTSALVYQIDKRNEESKQALKEQEQAAAATQKSKAQIQVKVRTLGEVQRQMEGNTENVTLARRPSLDERRAKKTEQLIKMQPNRIEEEPHLEDQLTTSKNSPTKAK